MTADKEKRRAISREAARLRRKAESDVFSDLSRLLPVPPSLRVHLDKPSVIRLTISYIRAHTLLTGMSGTRTETSQTVKDRQLVDSGEEGHHVQERKEDETQKEEEEDGYGERAIGGLGGMREVDLCLRVLGGFLMVISTGGDIVYLSENISTYMGLTQVELMGQSIYEFTHPCDQEEIRTNLRLPGGRGCLRGVERNFIMRMKSTITHTGRFTSLRSATWKVLRCQGRVKVYVPLSSFTCLVLICQPLPLPHQLLKTDTFTSQHSMDMRFTHCDHRVTGLLGYRPEELLGRSVYDLCHTLDTKCLTKSHMDLCSKSLTVSGQYRMLVRGGGYVWVESHSAVVPCARPSKLNLSPHQPVCIYCVTYVLSGVEEPSLQLSLDQTICRHVR